MNSAKRIVITGIGILSPLGIGTEIFWNSLIEGGCGINRVKRFPVEEDIYLCKIAAEVPEFDFSSWPLDDDPALQGRYAELALPALGMAIEDAGLMSGSAALRDADLYLSSAQETADTLEAFLEPWIKQEVFHLPPDTLSRIDPHAVTSAALRIYGIGNRGISLTASCASGVLSLMLCTEQIQAGKSEMGLAVSADAISPLAFLGEGLTGELSKRNDDPAAASRPFDSDQDGWVVGEGAVALVVETLSHAQAREAQIYAELGPFATTTDATSFKFFEETGIQMARGMKTVLDRVPAGKIDYINAHAPSIAALDRAESIAVRQAFGGLADDIPVTSIKGAIGNPGAVGGMFQLVSGILSIRDGIIPPTINLTNPLPGCDLDYVSSGARSEATNTVFISAHGGGGVNVALTIHGCP